MNKFTEKAVVGLSEVGLGLDELVRHGARQVIQQAIEAELAALLERFENVKTLHGQRAVVRNGYLPEREVLTAAGPIAVKVPKVRDRSGSGVKFNSSIVPPYVRKSPRVSAALPWLYLKGISTGDMSEALSVLLGDDAKGLSANVVSRLKAQWADEHASWSRRASVEIALRILVGRRHSHRAAQRELGRSMSAGDHRREAGWTQGACGDR
ncbi:transposase-like protein [Paraburkholderia sp. UCT70]